MKKKFGKENLRHINNINIDDMFEDEISEALNDFTTDDDFYDDNYHYGKEKFHNQMHSFPNQKANRSSYDDDFYQDDDVDYYENNETHAKSVNKKHTPYKKQRSNKSQRRSIINMPLLFAASLTILGVFVAPKLLKGEKQLYANKNTAIPTIEAQNGEWRVRPLDKTGIDIKFKDLTVLNDFDNDNSMRIKVEQLLPSPGNNQQDNPTPPNKQEISSNLNNNIASIDPNAMRSNIGYTPNNNAKASVNNIAYQPSNNGEIIVLDNTAPFWQVQILTVATQQDAKNEYKRINRFFDNEIMSKPAFIVKNHDGYTLRIGEFSSKEEALSLCNTIKSQGGDCLLTSPLKQDYQP